MARQTTQILDFEGIPVEITRKRVRYLRIVLMPPEGRVRMSVPRHVSDIDIYLFLTEKHEWIRRGQAWYAEHHARTRRYYTEDEIHYCFGEPVKLAISERRGRQQVRQEGDRLWLTLRPGHTEATRRKLLEEWYRTQLGLMLPSLLDSWQPRVGREVASWSIRRMKTCWGSCNVRRRHITFNLDLARRTPATIEYVVVHELVHLLEASHNSRFYRLMDDLFPDWRALRKILNTDPELAFTTSGDAD